MAGKVRMWPTVAERAMTWSIRASRKAAGKLKATPRSATFIREVSGAKTRSKFLELCRYLRYLHPIEKHIAIVCDNYSPYLTTKRCRRVAGWADTNNVEIAYTPTNSSWLNRVEAQFTTLRYFALDSTDHPTHRPRAA